MVPRQQRRAHLRTGAPPEENIGLMTALLADATNLGLALMARSSKISAVALPPITMSRSTAIGIPRRSD
jgi:hypothetical protein